MSDPITPETSSTTETPAAPEAAATTQPTTGSSLDELLADLDEGRRKVILDQVGKSRTEAKNLRDRLKAAEPKVAEYDRLAQASKSDLERAQESIAQEKTRASTAMQRLASAEIRAALAGVVDNPAAIVEDLNLSKFVGDDGEIDSSAVDALKAKYAGFNASRPPRPDSSQGSAAGGSVSEPGQIFANFLKSN